MKGCLERARVLRRFALQRGVSVGGQEGPLVQFLLPLEGYVQRRLVPLSRYSEASGAVEDDVDLRVFPELVYRYERVAEGGHASNVLYDDASPHAEMITSEGR